MERPGADDADYPIRTLISEKELRFAVTIKDPETHDYRTVEKVVEGPVSYIETTTQSQLHAENETRTFDLCVDESEEQTVRIFRAQNARQLGVEADADLIALLQDAQRLLKNSRVIIPFIEHAEFPTKPLRVRRDRTRFFAIVHASAHLHQRQRDRVTVNGQEFVVATIEDYAIAVRLCERSLAHTVAQTSPRVVELWKAAKEIAAQADDARFTYRDLERATGWNRKTVEKHAKAAERAGYFDLLPTERGKAHQFELGLNPEDQRVVLLSPEELRSRIATSPPPTHHASTEGVER
jgi:hypothetical protein